MSEDEVGIFRFKPFVDSILEVVEQKLGMKEAPHTQEWAEKQDEKKEKGDGS